MSSAPDPAAVLAALVLAPSTLPRNRFFDLFKRPELRGVRRRASELRELVRHLRDPARALVHRWSLDDLGRRAVEYEMPSLHFRRSLWLTSAEAAIVDVSLARSRGEAAPIDAEAYVLDLLNQRLNAA